MRLVHLECCCESMEPHAVNDFCHIFWPFNFVHLLNDIIRDNLFVNGTLSILCVIVQLSGLVIQTLVEFVWEHCILVNLPIFQTIFIRLFCSDYLFLFKWFNKIFSIFPTWLFCNVVEMNDLFIIISLSKRSWFNEIAEAGCLGDFVDESMRFWGIFFRPKLFEIEEISRIGMIWYWSIDVKAWIFDVAFIIMHYRTHEFQKRISDLNVVDLLAFLIDIHKHFEEGVINVVQVWMRSIVDACCRSHKLLSKHLVLSCWHLWLLSSKFAWCKLSSIQIHHGDSWWKFDRLVKQRLIKDMGLNPNEEGEGWIDDVDHMGG